MAKYKKISPILDAISVTDVLCGFKHNYDLLPEWIKEAYDNYIINSVTDDSMQIETIHGIVIANQDQYLIYENESIRIQNAEIFEKNYEKVGE